MSEEVVKTTAAKAVDKLLGQEANTIMLILILAALGYAYYYEQTVWRPSHNKEVREGYKDVALQHKEVVTELKDAFIKESDNQRKIFNDTVDRVERLTAGQTK